MVDGCGVVHTLKLEQLLSGPSWEILLWEAFRTCKPARIAGEKIAGIGQVHQWPDTRISKPDRPPSGLSDLTLLCDKSKRCRRDSCIDHQLSRLKCANDKQRGA